MVGAVVAGPENLPRVVLLEMKENAVRATSRDPRRTLKRSAMGIFREDRDG